MILDTSAVVAILLREPDHERLVDALAESTRSAIGSPTLAEAAIVLDSRLGRDGESVAREFLEAHEIAVLPFGPRHWAEAIRAFRRFGRGRHPAKLNFGDCMSYATAKLARCPLLCVGEDFLKTDLHLAQR